MTDELTPDQVEQNSPSRPDAEAPEEFTPEQAEALAQTGHLAQAEPKDELNPDEAEHFQALSIMNGTYGQGPVGVDDNPGFMSGNTGAAALSFYKTHDSLFRKTLYSLNLPQQALMRDMTASLAGLGMISGDTAKQLLSQQELQPSTILDYYWKPTTITGQSIRTMAGFASDIILDPMNMIGVGEAEHAVDIVGKTITGLEKMSTAQRSVFETMGEIEKVLTTDGSVLYAEDAMRAEEVTHRNLELLGQARDEFQQGNPLSFQGLQQSMNLSADGQKAVQSAMLDGLTNKSAVQQLAEGTRDLTVGLRIPFTNMAWEVKMPGPMSQAVGKGLSAVGAPGASLMAVGAATMGPVGATGGLIAGTLMNTMGPKAVQAMGEVAEYAKSIRSMDREVLNGKQRAIAALDNVCDLSKAYSGLMKIPQEAYNAFQSLWTKTGDNLFNDGMMRSLNLKGATEEFLAKQTNGWNQALNTVKQRVGPNQFKSLMEDFLNEAENGIHSPEEAEALVKNFRPENPMPQELISSKEDLSDWTKRQDLLDAQDLDRYKDLTRPTGPEQVARMERIAAHPELTDILGTMREQLKSMVGKYAERNMPFEELNPFGPGWMRRYVKHTFTGEFRDYLAKSSTAEDEFIKAMKGAEDKLGTFDESALGRKYRGSILDANEESMNRIDPETGNKLGIKVFVDNPVELFNMRIREMQEAVAKHDLISSAMPGSITGYNPGFGWMKLDPEEFGHFDSTVQVDRKTYKSLSFLPEDLRNKIANDQSVYFRTDVYDRMLWNTQKNTRFGQLSNTLAAADTYTWFWRNQVLGNFGYVGTKFFHNMLSYHGIMGNMDPTYMYKAMRAISLPGVETVAKTGIDLGEEFSKVAPEALVNWKQFDGSVIKLDTNGLMDLAVKHGVLGTGTNVLMDDVLDHAASAAGKQGGQLGKTLINYGYGFAAFRSLAQYGDDVPKLAAFVQRLESGFTAEAAAENSIKYFHNFKPVTVTQDVVKDIVPFISFPMKTAELMAEQVRQLQWGQLAMPGHVQDALRGKWVEDRDTREYVAKVMPNMRNWYDPLYGGLAPGMRSMMIELPWCYNTLSALWNEDMRQNPIFSLISGAFAVKNEGEELDQMTDDKTVSKVIGSTMDLMMPKPAKLAATLMAINGVKFPGSDELIERYRTKVPTQAEYMKLSAGQDVLGGINDAFQTPKEAEMARSALNTRFQNSVDFGKWMDKSYGSSWLYNLMFHGSMEQTKNSELNDEKSAMRGEFIRQHLRDVSLGLVEFDKLDQTMYSRWFAIDREQKKVTDDMRQQMNQTYDLVDPDKATGTEALKEAEAKGIPQAKRILRLNDEKDALVGFYDWLAMARKQAPDFSLYKLLFGIDQFQMSPDGKPGPQVSEALFRGNHNISDQDAKAYWNNQLVKTHFK